MPLVFIHGVATRPTEEYAAEVKQRDALFRTLVFDDPGVTICNPDWGSFAAQFGADLPWLPNDNGKQAFAVGEVAPGDTTLALGKLAERDGEQAVDLVAMAALDKAIVNAAKAGAPEAAATGDAMKLAVAAAGYLETKKTIASDTPVGIADLRTATNDQFADALSAEIGDKGVHAYGGNLIGDAIGYLGGLIGNGLSDLALKAKRRDASRAVSLFLGDVFVYLRDRDTAGPGGTRARLFQPILDDLVKAAKAPRKDGEPFVVVAHSLGGVILYDMLTDDATLAAIKAALGKELVIDALFTVGSQPGFFADLGLYPGGRLPAGQKRPRPDRVGKWLNVYDFTDVFSFLCVPMFDGVGDFGYDTVTDLVHAHTAYFQRPSFYKRLRARLQEAD